MNYGEVEYKEFEKLKRDIEQLEKIIEEKSKTSVKKYSSNSKSPKRKRKRIYGAGLGTPGKSGLMIPPPGGSVSIIENYNKKRGSLNIPRLRTDKIKNKILNSPITPELGQKILASDRNKRTIEKLSLKEKEEDNLSNSLYITNFSQREIFKSGPQEIDPIPEKSNEYASPRPHFDLQDDLKGICKELEQSVEKVSDLTEKLENSLTSKKSVKLVFMHHTDKNSTQSSDSSRKSEVLSNTEFEVKTPRGSEKSENKEEIIEKSGIIEEEKNYGECDSLAGCSYIGESGINEGFDDEKSEYTMISEFAKIQNSDVLWEESMKFLTQDNY